MVLHFSFMTLSNLMTTYNTLITMGLHMDSSDTSSQSYFLLRTDWKYINRRNRAGALIHTRFVNYSHDT